MSTGLRATPCLTRELDKRAARGRVDMQSVAAKRAAMQADRAVKLEALSAFCTAHRSRAVALRVVEADAGYVTMKLRRRKASRTIALEYDAVTRELVPHACEACGSAAARPAACDDAVYPLCERCAPRADGRITCPRCQPSSRRTE